jgi:HD superfamily phosphohydrolase YqeK
VRDDLLDSIRRELKRLLPPERYLHSLRVEEESRRLAEKYGADVHVSGLAGLLHDCARDLPDDEVLELALRSPCSRLTERLLKNPVLLHGPAGAVLAREK